MPEVDLPAVLARYEGKGHVIAPAGYGKTHLIANAVKMAIRKQLVLTHTYAGVNSLRSKMQAVGVPPSKYHIDTIASWCLRLCLSYPATSKWRYPNPTGEQWKELYECCQSLLEKDFARRMISASYAGIYVDEYQDCSDRQHELILTLAGLLPCRILGDPLQAIFDFNDKVVDWDRQVYPQFECLGSLDTPWRWNKAGASELGDWLKLVRTQLNEGRSIDLSGPLPKGIFRHHGDLSDYGDPYRLKLFYKFLKTDETVMLIEAGNPKSKFKTHKLAAALGGRFSSIEEVEGAAIFSFIKRLEAAGTTQARLLAAIEFSKSIFIGIGKVLAAGTKRGEYARVLATTKYPAVLNAANAFFTTTASADLKSFLLAISACAETQAYRRDLLNRILNILTLHSRQAAMSLTDAAHKYQKEFRHSGRPIRHTKLIATTLLVKGLEYDHAVVLNPDALTAKELYVALTRGSKSVTIVTTRQSIG
jgi:superfamily I DNA/RNA helicase